MSSRSTTKRLLLNLEVANDRIVDRFGPNRKGIRRRRRAQRILRIRPLWPPDRGWKGLCVGRAFGVHSALCAQPSAHGVFWCSISSRSCTLSVSTKSSSNSTPRRRTSGRTGSAGTPTTSAITSRWRSTRRPTTGTVHSAPSVRALGDGTPPFHRFGAVSRPLCGPRHSENECPSTLPLCHRTDTRKGGGALSTLWEQPPVPEFGCFAVSHCTPPLRACKSPQVRGRKDYGFRYS